MNGIAGHMKICMVMSHLHIVRQHTDHVCNRFMLQKYETSNLVNLIIPKL
jgi:hypothetical protein